ncbi:hypothetical protein ABW19_dt0200167 [Dactylella cylindrospora]|nr:hypothetical protein ABW19_dt0200167 [Dactylella cylindrospora]
MWWLGIAVAVSLPVQLPPCTFYFVSISSRFSFLLLLLCPPLLSFWFLHTWEFSRFLFSQFVLKFFGRWMNGLTEYHLNTKKKRRKKSPLWIPEHLSTTRNACYGSHRTTLPPNFPQPINYTLAVYIPKKKSNKYTSLLFSISYTSIPAFSFFIIVFESIGVADLTSKLALGA